MKRVRYELVIGVVFLLIGAGAMAQDKATKEAAEKMHDAAAQEPNSQKAAEMLCKAASMVPKNAAYQNDCNGAKRAIVDADQRNLNRALEAEGNGKSDLAKHFASIISGFDPSLHAQAQQLLAKLNGGDKPAVVAPPPPPTPNASVALLEQAQKAFDSGNLQGAKNFAGQVTDASVKPQANMLVSMVDRYSSLVASGHNQEDSKNYGGAIGAYESALAISAHANGDNLNDRIAHLKTQQVAVNTPPPSPPTNPNPNPAPNNNTHGGSTTPPAALPKPPEPSLDDKKKKAEDAYTVALNRKDLDGQERAMRQLLQLDPGNAGARSRLDDIQKQLTAALNRDPAKLEQTLHDAIAAFYDSRFEDAESELNRYLGADAGKKKGAALFYLGATEQARALLAGPARQASREAQARKYFGQARAAGYHPVEKYVSDKILHAWTQAGG